MRKPTFWFANALILWRASKAVAELGRSDQTSPVDSMTSADQLTPTTPVQALFFDLDETLLDGSPLTLPINSL